MSKDNNTAFEVPYKELLENLVDAACNHGQAKARLQVNSHFRAYEAEMNRLKGVALARFLRETPPCEPGTRVVVRDGSGVCEKSQPRGRTFGMTLFARNEYVVRHIWYDDGWYYELEGVEGHNGVESPPLYLATAFNLVREETSVIVAM